MLLWITKRKEAMTITESYNQDEKLERLYLRESYLEFYLVQQPQLKAEWETKLVNVRIEIAKMLNLISK